MADKNKKTIKRVTTTVVEEIETTSNEKTHIICILDRSGSMSTIIDDAIGGFNEFLNEQKKSSDEATITVATFDDQHEIIYDNVDIKKAENLNRDSWKPRGMTALYDAIGKTINSERERISKDKNKPDKVLVVIVTDGEENSSKEYTQPMIKSIISDYEKENWNFIYLAANQDAFSVGRGMGFYGGNTFTITTTSDGISNTFNTLNTSVSNYRSVSTDSVYFSSYSGNIITTSTSYLDDENKEKE